MQLIPFLRWILFLHVQSTYFSLISFLIARFLQFKRFRVTFLAKGLPNRQSRSLERVVLTKNARILSRPEIDFLVILVTLDLEEIRKQG